MTFRLVQDDSEKRDWSNTLTVPEPAEKRRKRTVNAATWWTATYWKDLISLGSTTTNIYYIISLRRVLGHRDALMPLMCDIPAPWNQNLIWQFRTRVQEACLHGKLRWSPLGGLARANLIVFIKITLLTKAVTRTHFKSYLCLSQSSGSYHGGKFRVKQQFKYYEVMFQLLVFPSSPVPIRR